MQNLLFSFDIKHYFIELCHFAFLNEQHNRKLNVKLKNKETDKTLNIIQFYVKNLLYKCNIILW